MWTGMVLENTTISRENLQRVPQALSPAIGFSQFSLRPFHPAVVTPAVTIGLIYLIILSFFSFAFYLPIHMKFLTPEGFPPMQFPSFIVWRWFATMLAYFFLSLAYSLISLAFQIPFANPSAPTTQVANNPEPYGKGTFVVYWMINYVRKLLLSLFSASSSSSRAFRPTRALLTLDLVGRHDCSRSCVRERGHGHWVNVFFVLWTSRESNVG